LTLLAALALASSSVAAFTTSVSVSTSTIPRRTLSIEETLAKIEDRIDLAVDKAQASIDRQLRTAAVQFEQLRRRGATQAAFDRQASRLKKGLSGIERTARAQLTRVVGQGMLDLRRHPDYERDFETDMFLSRAEAILLLQDMLNDAAQTIDDGASTGPGNAPS
jgi:hypothetical protein